MQGRNIGCETSATPQWRGDGGHCRKRKSRPDGRLFPGGARNLYFELRRRNAHPMIPREISANEDGSGTTVEVRNLLLPSKKESPGARVKFHCKAHATSPGPIGPVTLLRSSALPSFSLFSSVGNRLTSARFAPGAVALSWKARLPSIWSA